MEYYFNSVNWRTARHVRRQRWAHRWLETEAERDKKRQAKLVCIKWKDVERPTKDD